MMTLGEAAQILGGTLPANASGLVFGRVTTDSRGIRSGDLFVALQGERFDGHDFVAQALRDGAVGALVAARAAADPGADAPCIAVRDTRLALGQLARAWRARFTLPLIAVVGSNGKTTVTQMLAAILREHAGEGAFHTEGNLNNDIGLPLTLLRLRPHHRIGVVELGMNHPGEIAYLSGIARPTVALVNNAQREHQEFMHSVADVAAENASIFDFLPCDGTAIVNADDGYAGYFVDRAGARALLTFGLDRDADVRITEGGATFGSHVQLRTAAGEVGISLRIAGRHNVLNAAAAAAGALAAGVPLSAIAPGLFAFVPVAGRLVKAMMADGTVVLDDTYNANPDSVRAAIDVLHDIPGRRVLVLGKMGEVGEQGPAFHREVGDYARQRAVDALVTFGPEAEDAAAAYGSGAVRCSELEAVIAAARAQAGPGTTLLVKGSRSARMERVVQALLGRQTAHEGAH